MAKVKAQGLYIV